MSVNMPYETRFLLEQIHSLLLEGVNQSAVGSNYDPSAPCQVASAEPASTPHPPTPQADFGIGPVRYDFTFGTKAPTLEQISLINKVIQNEQVTGDRLLKHEARLICARYGREDPIKNLPAAQRMRIRRQLQEETAQYLVRNNLVPNQGDHLLKYTNEMVLELDKYDRPANPAEIALISGTIDGSQYSAHLAAFENIQSIINSRRCERKMDTLTGLLVAKLLTEPLPPTVVGHADIEGTQGLGRLTRNPHQAQSTYVEEYCILEKILDHVHFLCGKSRELVLNDLITELHVQRQQQHERFIWGTGGHRMVVPGFTYRGNA